MPLGERANYLNNTRDLTIILKDGEFKLNLIIYILKTGGIKV